MSKQSTRSKPSAGVIHARTRTRPRRGMPGAAETRGGGDQRLQAGNVETGGQRGANDERESLVNDRRRGTKYEITPKVLREIAKVLNDEVRELVAWFAAPLRHDDDGVWTSQSDVKQAKRALADTKARRRLTDDLLVKVASVYRTEAYSPRQAVAAFFDIPPDTASRWIREARRAGHLGEAVKPGAAGEKS